MSIRKMRRPELIERVEELACSASYWRDECKRRGAIKDSEILQLQEALRGTGDELNSSHNTKAFYWAVGAFKGFLFGIVTYAFYVFDMGMLP